MIKRRDALKTSLFAGAYAVLHSPWGTAEEPLGTWFDRLMRWAQLVWVDGSIPDYQKEENTVILKVPSILDHEVIVIALA